MSGEQRITARVGQAGRVEVTVFDLPAGHPVEVTVRPLSTKPERSIKEILEQSPGGLVFKTVEQVDQYIRGERESWGS